MDYPNIQKHKQTDKICVFLDKNTYLFIHKK